MTGSGQIGPSGNFSDIQAGMSEIRTKSDHPQAPRDVLNAAQSDIPRVKSPVSATDRPSDFNNADVPGVLVPSCL